MIKTSTNNEKNEFDNELIISNRLGLHARAAAQMVQIAQKYEAEVTLEKEGEAVDAKSVLSLLMLECPLGTKVTIRAIGVDSESAVNAISELIDSKFGEE